MIETENQTTYQQLDPNLSGPTSSRVELIKIKAKQAFNNLLKIYTNKKMFLYTALGIIGIILIIILIFVFNLRKKDIVKTLDKPKTSSTESVVPTTQPNPTKIQEIEDSLNKIKGEIINLDVKQSNLTPPNLDFDISF